MLVLRQFGVPASTPQQRETHIAEVQEAGTVAEELERLADGRVLTVPLERERGHGRSETDSAFSIHHN